MIRIVGNGASPGITAGPLLVYERAAAMAPDEQTIKGPSEEWARFSMAREQTVNELTVLSGKVREASGDAAARLFETYRLICTDPEPEAMIRERILGGTRAEEAVLESFRVFSERVGRVDDAYLSARAADVRAVAERILSALRGAPALQETLPGLIDALPGPVILASDDLTPGELAEIPREKLLGFVTAGGNSLSHTAILAKILGIPAVIGAGAPFDPAYSGQEAILDGTDGVLLIRPDEAEKARLIKAREDVQKKQQQLDALKDQPDVTKDGQRMDVLASIGAPEDVPAAVGNGAAGIGLLRTEFLFMARGGHPDEEEQFEAYKHILLAMNGRRTVIRTLDVSDEKRIGGFGPPEGSAFSETVGAETGNPGAAEIFDTAAEEDRGLRFCLNRPKILKTQLRAIYRAAVFGQAAILFPMVTGVREFLEAKSLSEEVLAELKAEGVPFRADVALGVMIETRSSVAESGKLAQTADFFSVGTNDLTRGLLAENGQKNAQENTRENTQEKGQEHFLLPRLLEELRAVTKNAHRYGIRVGVCGELAADRDLTETFLSLGVDELSVPPQAVLPLRKKIRESGVKKE